MEFAWDQIGRPPVTLSHPRQFSLSPTFTAPVTPEQVQLVFRLYAFGFNTRTGVPDTVTITVDPVPKPIANAGPDQTVAAGALVQLNGTGSSDPSGFPLTYKWTQTGGPAVTLSSSNTISPTFTAPASGSLQTIAFQLVVTNTLGVSSSIDTVMITVSPSSTLPPQVPDCTGSLTGLK